jgi:CCR4-NOT transcription complex subunit 3
MARSGDHRQPEKSVDAHDFPTIPLLPKRSPVTPSVSPPQVFRPVEVSSPNELLQTDAGPQLFARALPTAFDLIPDVPYDNPDYRPQNPVAVPHSYPYLPNMKLLQPEFFKNYDEPTLFYVFFYFAGTPQQIFAGRELKQRGWRFHTLNQTWYRRTAEPIEVTPQYEIGAVEYFDHKEADAWQIRETAGFKFEYQFLETE